MLTELLLGLTPNADAQALGPTSSAFAGALKGSSIQSEKGRNQTQATADVGKTAAAEPAGNDPDPTKF